MVAGGSGTLAMLGWLRGRRGRGGGGGGGATAGGAGVSGAVLKGKTGVELRYHSPEKFAKLSKEQKTEVSIWNRSQPKDVKERTRGEKNGGSKKAKVAAAKASEVMTVPRAASAGIVSNAAGEKAAALAEQAHYLAGYILALLVGKVSPTAAVVKELMEAGGFVVDQAMLDHTIGKVDVKQDHELIHAGRGQSS